MALFSRNCDVASDDTFGPVINGCRQDFDFTLLFEQSILSILPSSLFFLNACWRILALWKRPSVLKSFFDWLLMVKLLVIFAFAAVQIILIVGHATSTSYTRISLAASVVSLATALPMAAISYLDHHRSLSPSFILGGFLLLTTLCDIAQTRTLFLRGGGGDALVTRAFTAQTALKCLLLGLESVEKRGLLQDSLVRSSPEVLGGIVSRGVFWWLNGLLIKGSGNILQQDQLMPLDERLLPGSIEVPFRQAWAARDRKVKKHGLARVTAMFFRRQALMIVVPRVCLIGFRIAQPLLIYRAVSLLASFKDDPDNQTLRNQGRGLIGATVLIYLGIAIATGTYRHQTYRGVAMVRAGLVTLIYDSTLYANAAGGADKASVTLMSTDIDQIVMGLENSDVLWATPIEIALSISIIAKQIKLAVIAPVIVVVVCTSSAVLLSRKAPKYQKAWMVAIQERVSATASMLGIMKAVRMTGLSRVYISTIHELRVKELRDSVPFRWVSVVTNVLGTASRALTPVGAFVTYALLRNTRFGGAVDSATIFSSLTLLSLLAQPLMRLMFVLPLFLGSLACFDRIDKYISKHSDDATTEADRNGRDGLSDSQSEKSQQRILEKGPSDAVEMSSLRSTSDDSLVILRDASFRYQGREDAVLHNLTTSIAPGTLIIVTGPVGSGKTTLLLSLLGETDLISGSMFRNPNISLGYCSQETWLPNMTIRQAILGSRDFDKAWYEQVINACALEQDFIALDKGDETMVGTSGIALSGGQKQRISLARALYARPGLLLLDDVTSGLDAITEAKVVRGVFGPAGICKMNRMAAVLTSHKLHFQHLMHQVWVLEAGGCFSVQNAQTAPVLDDAQPEGLDETSPRLSLSPSNGADLESSSANTKPSAAPQAIKETKPIVKEDKTRKEGDMRMYLYYLKAMGLKLSLLVAFFSTTSAFMSTFPTVWLQWWSDSEMKHPGRYEARWLGVYTALGLAACIFHGLLLWAAMVKAVPPTSIKMHKVLLDRVMAAPMSFFGKVDDGVTVNRFSQDMSLIDNKLPGAMVATLDGVFLTVATLVIVGISSKWTALTFPFLFLVMYVLQKFYLRTSRQLRLLDLESKNSLYTNFLETMQGVVTIRAFSWQGYFRQRNSGFLAEAQKPFYLMFGIQVWLNVILDMILCLIMVLTVALAMELSSNFSPGSLGLVLANIANISAILAYVVQSWTMMETSIGAMARLCTFLRDTVSEHLSHEVNVPAAQWPSRGRITMNSLHIKYSAEGVSVLRDINLDIEPGTKVGVCGRTGSGKSSLVLSILRINEIAQGSIEIDGQDLSPMPRDFIREHLTALPQDAALLDGSLRFNIDPFSKHTDKAILDVLQSVSLGHLSEPQDKLDAKLPADELSAGQKQLLCVARAMLNQSKVLLLDEATSAVDRETEDKVVELVRDKFQGCTVLAVAHRLRTLVDFDRIVFLEDGVVEEDGSPQELLAKEGSRFAEAWKAQQ